MNLQMVIPARVRSARPTWDVDPFPTYVGMVAAPAPPPLAPIEGELLEADEALDILERLLLRRRAAAEPPTVVIARVMPGWSELLEGDDEEALDLDRFCASFAAAGRELATA